MENLIPLIIQLVSGAAGGNAAGSLLKKLSLGKLWNSVLGIIGGGLGGQLLGMLGLGIGGNATDLNGIIGNVIGGGVGGGALMGIVGFAKKLLKK
ncbi:MAG: hypothetical protein ABFR36_05365 [Acidobacteriota bacterium]